MERPSERRGPATQYRSLAADPRGWPLESPAPDVLRGLPNQDGRNQLPYLRYVHGISPPFGRGKCSDYSDHLAVPVVCVSDKKHKSLRKSREID